MVSAYSNNAIRRSFAEQREVAAMSDEADESWTASGWFVTSDGNGNECVLLLHSDDKKRVCWLPLSKRDLAKINKAFLLENKINKRIANELSAKFPPVQGEVFPPVK